MDALPEISYRVPFGSLTNNSLLSGLGPGWPVQLQPQGYVQGEIRQTAESLSINTTRYCAVLHLSVTVNMILDGSTRHPDRGADLPARQPACRRRDSPMCMRPGRIEFALENVVY